MPRLKTLVVQQFGSRQIISESFLKITELPLLESILKENMIKDAQAQGYRPIEDFTITWDAQSFKYVTNDEENLDIIACDSSDDGAWRYAYGRFKVVKNATI